MRDLYTDRNTNVVADGMNISHINQMEINAKYVQPKVTYKASEVGHAVFLIF